MSKLFYKHPKYGTVFCNEDYNTPVCRLAWPSLVNPKSPPPPKPGEQQGMPRFEATLLYPKDSEEHVQWIAEMTEVVEAALQVFNAGRPAKISEVATLQDGDSSKWDKEKYPYYANQELLVARNTAKPVIIGMDDTECDPKLLHGGCLVMGIVSPLITPSGVSYKLKAIKLVKDDGVQFAGGAKASGDYIKMLSTKLPVKEGTTEEPAEEAVEETEIEEAPVVKKAPITVKKAAPVAEVKKPATTVLRKGKASIASML